MRHRFLMDSPPVAKGFATTFGDLTFLLLAFFVLVGSWTALGGHLHAALPRDMSGGG